MTHGGGTATAVPDGAAGPLIVDGEADPSWHKLRQGADRYLCGRSRGRYRGLPAQGGGPGPRRKCPVCEVIYLNLMLD